MSLLRTFYERARVSLTTQTEQRGTAGRSRQVPPLSYINRKTGWTGYCPALRDYLQAETGRTVAVELVELPSILGDRYDLVRDGQVYLECGPNTVRTDIEGIEFSNLIFATGSCLLTTTARAPQVNPA